MRKSRNKTLALHLFPLYIAGLPPYFTLERIETMASLNPAKFIREVREEAGKIAWPSRRETVISTTMVLVLVAIAATFFIFIDWIISSLVRVVLGI